MHIGLKNWFLGVGGLIILAILGLESCKKTTLYTSNDALLEFEMDTLTFDTVFTDMGSATRSFKVYNPFKQPILVSSISLAGGAASDFHLNIDGQNTLVAEEIEIPAEDSIYIFANVRIDPNNGDAIREDSILFRINGNEQRVILNAYGWDANYYSCRRCITLYTNEQLTITADKPNIFMGWMLIDTNSTITIEPGAEIYMFGGPSSNPIDRALLFIGENSSIKSNVGGDLNNPVVFQTHRLEEDYQALPFHHNGIYLSSRSVDNQIHGTIIRNALDGIFVDSSSLNANPKLEIKNSMIYNTERSGILGRQADIYGENVVLASSNQYNLITLRGGNYTFNHCTFVNYAENVLVSRNEAVLSMRDFEVQYDEDGNEFVVVADGDIQFTNCIIDGSRNEEVEMVQVDGSTAQFDWNFDHCLMKLDTFSTGLTDCIINQDAFLTDPSSYDYTIDTTASAAANSGITIQNITHDALNVSRPQGAAPDLGAFELVE